MSRFTNYLVMIGLVALAFFLIKRNNEAVVAPEALQKIQTEIPLIQKVQALPSEVHKAEKPPIAPTTPSAPSQPAAAPEKKSLPTNEDEIDYLAVALDYFEPNVFPRLKGLPSPCLAICNPSTFNMELTYTGDPEYEVNFFKAAPEKAFEDPEFRMRAEKLRAIATWNPPEYRQFKSKVWKQYEGMSEEEAAPFLKADMARLRAHSAEFKRYRPQMKRLDEIRGKFRDIRDECGSESPAELQKQCFELLAPTGQFPEIRVLKADMKPDAK